MFKTTSGIRFLPALLACAAACVCSCALASSEYDPDIKFQDNAAIRLKRALPAFGGMLMGFDGGDWNGALVFLAPSGKSTRIYTGNIMGIVNSGRRILVFSSLAHLSGKRGELLEVTRNGNALPAVRKLADLDGRASAIQPFDNSGDVIVFRLFKDEYRNEHGVQVPVYQCKKLEQGIIRELTPCPSSYY